jgi:DNA-binding transcriptional regulator LsrR (DeoR family)
MGAGRSSEQEVGMVSQLSGPASLVLSASVARRYYLDGRSKVEIAEEFGLSRFKVARLIETARASGLVRIEIGSRGLVDVDLSARVQEAFGLEHAVVVDTPEGPPDAVRKHLGQVAAELLAEVVVPEDVLGVAWARSVGAMAKFLPRLPTVPVVQLTGAVALPGGGDTSFDIVRDVARATGGPAYVFYAPIVLQDAATAASLRSQSDIARAFAHAASVTKAVVGIGRCEPGESTLYDAASDADHDELRRLGVCGEVCGVFVDGDGEPVETALAARVIAIDAERLRAVPDVMAIAYGAGKLPAARAVLRSGLVSSLVTSQGLARGLLEPA